MNHGKDIGNGDVNVLACGGVRTEADGGGTKEGADVIGLLNSRLGTPDDIVTISEDGGAESAAIVTTHTNQHQPKEKSSIISK